INFNADISNWNTSNCQSFNSMFDYAESFNQDISGWNTSSCINMFAMFNEAHSFNQNLGNWDMSGQTNLSMMLNNTNLSIANYDATLIGWASQTLQPVSLLSATGLQYCN